MSDRDQNDYRDRKSMTKEQKAERKAIKAAEAEVAMAEHEAAEQFKYANMERLKAMRLANTAAASSEPKLAPSKSEGPTSRPE